jgi:excisionase family DNA binding protein
MTGSLLTTRQVADLVGLSPETILRKWRAGELPGYRIGSNVLRFDEADIDAWLAGCRVHDRPLVAVDEPEGERR